MTKQDLNFLAIDFETATPDKMACQLGIVVVERGVIIEERSWLIQPANNKYNSHCVDVHGITPEDTMYCRTFDKVWKEIQPYFENTKVIVAHNMAFDREVLLTNLDYYKLSLGNASFASFECNYQIYGKSLHDLCDEFGINADKHHNALFDAECCAKFYIAYQLGEKEIHPHKVASSHVDPSHYHERISGDLLQKDLSNADPDNPFYDKKVVITGVFNIDRKELASTLKRWGADIDTGITKRTNIVLVGDDPGPKKIEKLNQLLEDGYDIAVITKDMIDEMM